MKLSLSAEIFIFSSPAPIVSAAHYRTSPLIWRSVRPRKTSFSAKNTSCLKLYIIIKIHFFGMNMPFFSSREARKWIFHWWLRHSWNMHFIVTLDEINGIFIPKIWISSIYLKCYMHIPIRGIVDETLVHCQLSLSFRVQITSPYVFSRIYIFIQVLIKLFEYYS